MIIRNTLMEPTSVLVEYCKMKVSFLLTKIRSFRKPLNGKYYPTYCNKKHGSFFLVFN